MTWQHFGGSATGDKTATSDKPCGWMFSTDFNYNADISKLLSIQTVGGAADGIIVWQAGAEEAANQALWLNLCHQLKDALDCSLSHSLSLSLSLGLLKVSRSVFKKNKMQTQLGNLNSPPHGMHTYAGDCI